MSPLKFKRSRLPLLICPKCRKKHEYLVKTEGVDGVDRFICYYCGHDFGEDDSKLPWITQRVQTIVCPDCGEDVTCSSGNIMSRYKIQQLVCPFCKKIIAVKLTRRWISSQEALFNERKEGLLKVNDRQDLFAVIYFKTCANEEGGAWLSSRLQDGKILWVEGEAVGYYLANSQQIFEKGSFHCLRQIFVAPQYRNKGYGTIMLYDFLEGREHVVIEAPNEKLLGLLKKNDLVDADGRSRQISYVTLM